MLSSISSSSGATIFRISLFAALIYIAMSAVNYFFPLSSRDNESYLMGVVDNLERLEATKDDAKRILLLGGSSLGWGVSAEHISKVSGVKTLNLGVQAGIGYRNIWSIHREKLDPSRDVIVLSPEVGMIFNSAIITDQYCNVLRLAKLLSPDYFLCAPIGFVSLLKGIFLGDYLDEGVYKRSGFNAYGDYVYHYELPKTDMSFGASEYLDQESTDNAVREYQAFVGFLADMGFKVVLIPPIAARSVCLDEDLRFSFFQKLADKALHVFEREFPFCVDDDLFFNTSYHMTKEGVDFKTDVFLRQLNLLGII